ncbi:MAG: thioredoxin family protein [Gemmatimonadota bacterium]
MDQSRFSSAHTMEEFIAGAVKNAEFWEAAWRITAPDDALVERARALRQRWHLLALSEDWCGDAINILPTVARLCEQLPNFEFRVLGRDSNPDLMDSHLTRGTRSIPIVMVYDSEFTEVGWWGPRPAALQAWFYDEGKAMEKTARYRHLRTWYARDRGRTTLSELLDIIATAEAAGREPSSDGAARS